MKKSLKITIWIIASVLVAIMLFLGVYFLWPWNADFFKYANKEFAIPGLDTAFVPQGMANVKGYDKYLISGYMSDGSPSRLYLTDTTSGENVYVTLMIDDKDYVGHAGGVEVYNDTVWVVSEGSCYCINLNNILNASNGDAIAIKSKFEVGNTADFVFENNGVLWIGEFHKDGKYDTDETHHIKTSSGKVNKAIMLAFNIDTTNTCGVVDTNPVMAMSIPSLVQGVAVDDKGQFVLSTSYSLPDSNLYVYENVLLGEYSSIKINNNSIPLYILDDEALKMSLTIPSMSEELVVEKGKLYILFESACKKYRLFNRKRLYNVYSIELSILDK